MIIHVETKEEYLDLIKEGRVLVDFYAVWCGPCQMLSPIIEKIAEEHPEVKVIKIDCDKNPEIASLYRVYSIPTLLYIKDGKLINTTLGYQPEARVKKFAEIE